MWWHCGVCGFEWEVPGPLLKRTCPACKLSELKSGQAPNGGFRVHNQEMTVRGIPKPPVVATPSGKWATPSAFNYFNSLIGDRYRPFIIRNTTFVGGFTHVYPPNPDQFAWLSPYTGNAHNRTFFTQLVLSAVAREKFVNNAGRFPRLIEPFVGSGQVFLNACAHGPMFNQGVPLFKELIAGDLNPFVLAGYRLIANDAAERYCDQAERWDATPGASFDACRTTLNLPATVQLLAQQNPDLKALIDVAACYIYVVNRCLHGSLLNSGGGVTANINPSVNLSAVRKRERTTLAAVRNTLGGIRWAMAQRDFAQTCALAKEYDIVFMDCPFPKFSATVPTKWPTTRLETLDARQAGTYGTDDGPDLQTRIVEVTRQLRANGTTVVLCNFANPGLVMAYRELMTNVKEADKRHYLYTYRSPTTTSEAYQIAIIPGDGVDLSRVPVLIRKEWIAAGGDDGWNVDDQEFFREAKVDDSMESDSMEEDDPEDTDYDPRQHG